MGPEWQAGEHPGQLAVPQVLAAVKNTFLHFEQEPPGSEELQRCRTDPTPGHASPSAVSREASSPRPPGAAAAWPPAWAEEAALPATEACSVWSVDARKLQSKDTRLSRTPHPGFVVTLYPKAASKRRGQACFLASKGLGTVHVKCNRPAEDAELCISVTVGRSEHSCMTHNFAHNPVCQIPRVWDFASAVDGENLEIALEVSPAVTPPHGAHAAGLPLTRSPTPPAEAMSLDEAEEWPASAASSGARGSAGPTGTAEPAIGGGRGWRGAGEASPGCTAWAAACLAGWGGAAWAELPWSEPWLAGRDMQPPM